MNECDIHLYHVYLCGLCSHEQSCAAPRFPGVAHVEDGPAHLEVGPAHVKVGPAHVEVGPVHVEVGPVHVNAKPGMYVATESYICSFTSNAPGDREVNVLRIHMYVCTSAEAFDQQTFMPF